MEIQFRLARKNDLECILEMSEGIYNGHDYFPHVFLRWLEDSKRGIIVAEKDNTVIGLRAFHIVDDGKTVVSQSLRVHPKYRRQGISAALIQAERQYVRVHFPSVVTERYTTMSSNVQRLAIQRKTTSDSLVLEMGIIAFYVNSTISSDHEPGDLFSRFKEKITGASKVKRLTSGEFRDLLGEKLDGVTRENTMIIDWEPFKVHASNTTNGLVKDRDCFFVSFETEKKREVESLSHGRQSPRVKCLHWVATIYTSDVKLLKIHIVNQLESAILQAKNTPFIFSCFLHTSRALVSCAKDFLSQEFSLKYVDFFNFNLLLFEKDFVD